MDFVWDPCVEVVPFAPLLLLSFVFLGMLITTTGCDGLTGVGKHWEMLFKFVVLRIDLFASFAFDELPFSPECCCFLLLAFLQTVMAVAAVSVRALIGIMSE